MSRNFQGAYRGGAGGSRNITVMTDGACTRNGQPGARAGVGVHFPNGELNDISRPVQGGRQTNQRAEIEAATTGIRAAREAGYENITVKTDSAYVKNAMDSWVHDWRKTDYKGVTNHQEFRELDSARAGANVNFEWIPRDANNVADDLAKHGSK